MKTLLLTALTCLFLSAHAQTESQGELAAGKGTWMVSLGWEGGIYFNDVETNLFGFDSVYTDTAGAYYIPLAVEYCFSNRFSGGLQIKAGRYIEDEDYRDNSAAVVDLFLNFHFLKRQRHDLFARLSVGGASLVIEDRTFDSRGEWGGAHAGLGLGYRFFFGKHIGLYTMLSSSVYNLEQNSLTAGNTTIDPDDLSYSLGLRGYEFGLGLIGRF